MNALVNLKKDTWVCMFCGKNYQASHETDRFDMWDKIPTCKCEKSWEYKCIQSKKEAKEFRSKYAKFIIKKGKIEKKGEASIFTSYTPVEGSLEDLLEKVSEEKNLTIKADILENIVKELYEKMVNNALSST